MTINMGKLDDKSLHNKKIKLKVAFFGMNDKVAAVKVDSPVEHYEGLPHITLAVNRDGGGAPKDSKDIRKWRPIGRPFYITGKVTEVPLDI